MAAILFMCRTGPLALLPVRSLAANPAGRAEFVQQHRLELIEQARLGPLVQPPRSGVVGWQQRLDVLSQRHGQQSVHETGHGREHPSTSPNHSSSHRRFRNVYYSGPVRNAATGSAFLR
jgi:hypothetical protein